MLQAISIYLLIGILINLLVDLMYDWIGRNNMDYRVIGSGTSDEDRWDTFTKVFVVLLWPLCLIYILVSIIKEYTK
jgi:ABC-type Fe3+ transport system permease subunit